jgi:RNA polymerase sigma-70 factor (ECF subfamily)
MMNKNSESSELYDLLQKARTGNTKAFEQLFQFHRDTLRQIVALSMDPHLSARVDASDIIQDAYAVAAQRFPNYLEREPVSFRVWLRQIVQDQLLMACRRHMRADRRSVYREIPLPEQSSVALAEQLTAQGPAPSQQIARAEQIRHVRVALGQLGDEDREILLMRHFEQLSYKEIGYILHLESAAARKRYGRALIRLGNMMRNTGFTESQL